MSEVDMVSSAKPSRTRREELASAADEAAQLFELEVAKKPSRARLAHQARRIAAVLRMGGE